MPLENAEIIIASSYKNLRNGNEFDGTEQIKIKLKNSSLVFDFEEIIDQLLIDQDVVNEYSYESSAKATEILNMTIFTIDIFFYPFIVLLMCASLFNIHNVLNGNIYIKEKDLRILKSVGMEKKQWRQIIMYEYLEGYISASFFMTIILITISYLSKYFYIGKLLELNIHLISIIFISIFALGPLVLIPICFMNIYLNSINNIK